MKLSPFATYFAGVGTVVAALAVGFGSAVFLTSTPGAQERAVASAARSDEAKPTKIEKFKAAKREDSAATAAASTSSNTLLAATITVPVDVKSGAVENGASATATPQDQQPVLAPKDGVQGTAPFEGADNAVEIKPSKKPIAEASKSERKRRVAQRKTRDVIVQPRHDEAEDARASASRAGDGYRVIEETTRAADGTRIVRTYETRSRDFGGFVDAEDD